MKREKLLWAAAGVGAGMLISRWWIRRQQAKLGMSRVDLLPPAQTGREGTSGIVGDYGYGPEPPDYQIDPRGKAFGAETSMTTPMPPPPDVTRGDVAPVPEEAYFDEGEFQEDME